MVLVAAGTTVPAPSADAVPNTGPTMTRSLAAGVQASPPTPRRTRAVKRWSFAFNPPGKPQRPGHPSGRWARVSVPHTWNAQDGTDGGGSLFSGGNYRRGAGWYRTTITVKPGQRRHHLEFDGAMTVADVYVDGQHLARHAGGYTRFRVDLTRALADGRAVVAVKVDNRVNPDVAPLAGDFTVYGGLYRAVRLISVAPVHVDLKDLGGPGLYLRTTSLTATHARVRATVKVRNASGATTRSAVRVTVLDARGTVVSRSRRSLSVPAKRRVSARLTVGVRHPHLWNGTADPYLYRVRAEVLRHGRVVDAVTQPLGLRRISVSATSGVSLNGRHLQVKGVSRHQDVAGRGAALRPSDIRRDFAMMREMGANAVRTAHYPQSQLTFEEADRRGMLVYTEVPLVSEVTDSPAFRANVVRQAREMVRQNLNHPSVYVWGIGNELGLKTPQRHRQHQRVLEAVNEAVHRADPTRPTSYANAYTALQLRAPGDLQAWNHYFGWYVGSHSELGPWLDRRRATTSAPLALSEYGAGGSVTQHQEPTAGSWATPMGRWHPEEQQALFHQESWKQVDSRRYLWGSFVWNMFDFGADGRSEGDRDGINDKGLVTFDRATRKDAFYFYQSVWTQQPMLHVNSRRWTQRTAASTTVVVYANAGPVQLRLNGVDQGPGHVDGTVHTWPVTLRPGANTVVATSGGLRDQVQWNLTP